MVEQTGHPFAYQGQYRRHTVCQLRSDTFVHSVIQVYVALSVQASAIVTCYLRSARIQDMPSSPEGALILLNLTLCILGPVLIRQAWRWHIS